jgi:DNA-binding transcriptional LysR family regulator
MENDREAIEVALKSANPQREPRVVRIANTLHLMEYWISPALLNEARAVPNLEIISQAEAMRFDADGNLYQGIDSPVPK